MMRFRLRTLLIAVTVCCLLLGLAIWMTPEIEGDYYVTQRFSLRDDRELIIWAQWFWEIRQGICYEIREGDRTLVTQTCFDDEPTGVTPEFDVVLTPDGDAVGCFDIREPTKLRAVYEFSSDEGWPGGKMWWNLSPIDPKTTALEKDVRDSITRKLRP